MIKRILLAFIILISCGISTLAQDVTINARNTNFFFDSPNQPNSIAWVALSSRVYIAVPLGPDYGYCVSIVNNNPTSAHTFTVTAFQTGDSNVPDYSHNTGRYVPLSVINAPASIAASASGNFFVKSNGASKIAFVFTGATTQAGSPDTVDIYGVQTTSNGCGTLPSTINIPDPCLQLSNNRSTAAVSIAAAGTTQIIPLTSNQTIYPCTIMLSLNSDSSSIETVQFEYGTGASCGTGTTILSGPMKQNSANGGMALQASGPTQFGIPASNALCIVTAQVSGAVINVNGFITYVKQ